MWLLKVWGWFLKFWGILWSFSMFWEVFLSFQWFGVIFIILVVLGIIKSCWWLEGILVVLEVSRLVWSFQRFPGGGGIFVIFEVLRMFRLFWRFQGTFLRFLRYFGHLRDLAVFYHCRGFCGILEREREGKVLFVKA